MCTKPADPPSVVRTAEEHDGDVQAARGFLRHIDRPFLVDVHTHFMPANVLSKVWHYFDHVAPAKGMPWPIIYRGDDDERVMRLTDLGVGVFSSLSYPHRPGMAEWLNAWSAGFAVRNPGCLRSGTFYPEPEAADYVPALLAGGVDVFKAHVQVGAYDPADPLLDPVWGALAESGTPVVIHCGSGPEPGPHTGPGPIVEVLRRHRGLRLVIAHMGFPEYSAFLDLTERFPGVMLDTTMVFTDFIERRMPFPRDERSRLADLGGRILLGSDFPNIPYPYVHQLDALAALDLGDDWLAAVCHDNGVKLFGACLGGLPPATGDTDVRGDDSLA